jgi:hypothetical protein
MLGENGGKLFGLKIEIWYAWIRSETNQSEQRHVTVELWVNNQDPKEAWTILGTEICPKKKPKPEPLFVALRAQPPRTDFRDGCSSPVILKLPEDSQRENGEKIREKSSVTRKVLQWKSDIHRVFWRWSVSLKAKHRTSAAAAPTTLLRNFDNVEPSATGILLGGAADSGHVLRMFHPDKWDLY